MMEVVPFIPYWGYVKAVAAALLLLLVLGAGCSIQKGIDSKHVNKALAAKVEAEQKYSLVMLQIEESNKRVLEAEKEAALLAEKNEALAKEASAQKKQKDRAAKEYQKKLEAAKRDPSCASLLEMKLCEAVSGY